MTKRLAHYLILAVFLLGVPLACCIFGGHEELLEGVKSFPPRTEDWGLRPELLWSCRRPFDWRAFAGLAAFTLVCLYPFAKRVLRFVRSRGAEFGLPFTSPPRGRFPWWGWLGAAVLASGWILSWNYRFGWFPAFPARVQVQLSYAPLWAGFILVMNALCVKRSGHSPMTDHPLAYAATFPASSLFWWFFEYLNRYVWNWYYLGISELGAAEYAVYATVCFASVLPAVCAVAAWLHTFPVFDDKVFSGMARVNLRKPRWCAFLGVLAAIGLTGIVFFPDYTYPLLWISPVAMFLLVQFLMRERCVLDPVAHGNWSVFIRFAIASLVCGLCWETWNYYALAKWVYSVPWVQRFQIWEMPLIGFAGYLPFGVECAAVTAWILPALVAPCGSPAAKSPSGVGARLFTFVAALALSAPCLALGTNDASSVESAIDRGARFLLASQAEGGHWSDAQMPALTALPVWALSWSGVEAEGRDNAVSRGVEFILSTQRDDGGFYVPKPGRGGSGLGNYNTSVCLSALFECGKAPPSAMLKARDFIASSQLVGDDTMAGGFGYEKISRRRYADLSNTSYAMDAMRRTASLEELRPGNRRVDIDWDKALAFVEGLQKKEGDDKGGAAYNERTPQGGTATNATGQVSLRAYGSMSYAAVLSMCSANLSKSDPRVRNALEYCTKYWTVDENPGMGIQGLYYYYDILARALSASGVGDLVAEDGRLIPWRSELARKLVSLQREDGSWANKSNRFWEADPVLCTSFAMLALELCRSAPR